MRIAAQWILCVLSATGVSAEPVRLSGSITITNDYRFRGVSQSDGDPAVQANIEANASSGVYAGLWGSSVSGTALSGGVAEVDGYVGYRQTRGSISTDFGVQIYSAPDARSGSGHSRAEAYASVDYTLPKLSTDVRLGTAIAPKQGQYPHTTLYDYVDVAQPVPTTPLTLRAHLGYTLAGGGSGPSLPPINTTDHLDYEFGLAYVWHKLTATVSAVGTDISPARAQSYSLGSASVRTATKPRLIVALTARF